MGVGEHHAGASSEEDDKLHVALLPLTGELRLNVKQEKYCGESSTGCPFIPSPHLDQRMTL